ncbi:MAG: winged helix-turn-helix domain-containing protein [Acidimicrobiales bacterium]
MRSSSREKLSAAQARRVALAAQGFADPRPSGTIDRRHLRRVVERVGVVQIDSVNVLVRSHELAFFSRLGPYRRELLTRHVERHRQLFEYWGHMASFVPVDLHPLLRWRMAAHASAETWDWHTPKDRDFPEYAELIYEEVAARGPLAASELTDGGKSSGAWWGWGDGKAAMEFLFWSGRITAASRRSSFERLYDLTERVLPPAILSAPTPDEADAKRRLLQIAARALGVATAADLADYFRIKKADARLRLAELVEEGALLPVEVEGWPEPAYLHSEARLPRRVSAGALLSPFDSLVWERDRTERLFGFRYRIEIYTPAPKRIYGYYVLPFLLGDQLVARIDLKADRKGGALLALGSHTEPPHDAAAIAGPLAEELRAMASWRGLERIEVGDRGDLAPALRAAVLATG